MIARGPYSSIFVPFHNTLGLIAAVITNMYPNHPSTSAISPWRDIKYSASHDIAAMCDSYEDKLIPIGRKTEDGGIGWSWDWWRHARYVTYTVSSVSQRGHTPQGSTLSVYPIIISLSSSSTGKDPLKTHLIFRPQSPTENLRWHHLTWEVHKLWPKVPIVADGMPGGSVSYHVIDMNLHPFVKSLRQSSDELQLIQNVIYLFTSYDRKCRLLPTACQVAQWVSWHWPNLSPICQVTSPIIGRAWQTVISSLKMLYIYLSPLARPSNLCLLKTSLWTKTPHGFLLHLRLASQTISRHDHLWSRRCFTLMLHQHLISLTGMVPMIQRIPKSVCLRLFIHTFQVLTSVVMF